MRFLLDIAERVRARVRETHGDVISRVLDALDNHIETAEAEAKACSYGAVLGHYTALKVTAHHAKRALCDGIDSQRWFHRLQESERRVRFLKYGMYARVCLECDACRSRRKAWPVNTMFAPASANRNGASLSYVKESDYNTGPREWLPPGAIIVHTDGTMSHVPYDGKTIADCAARFTLPADFRGHPPIPE